MNNIVTRAAGTALVVLAVAGNANDDSEYRQFVTKTSNLSILNLEALANSYAGSDLTVFVPAEQVSGRQLLPRVVADQNAQFENMLDQRTIFEQEFTDQNRPVAEALSFVESAAGRIPNPLPEFVLKATSTYLDAVSEELAKQKEEAGLEAVKRFYDSKKYDPKRLAQAKSRGIDAFVIEMKRQAGANGQILDKLGEKESRAALLRLGEFTIAATANNSLQISQLKQDTDNKFSDLYKKFAEKEQRQDALFGEIQSLSDQTRENTAALKELTEKIDAQHGNLMVIESVLFRRGTVEDQLEILKVPGALGLSDADRKALSDNLQQRATIVENARKWNDFICTGRDALGIMSKIGMDPAQLQGLQKSIGTANILHGSITAALSGNYISAATAIAGLFGGVGQSAEEQRHAEVIAKLNQIINNQQLIIKALDDMAKMIHNYQLQVLSSLDSVYALQGATLNAFLGASKLRLNNCSLFLDRRRLPKYGYSFDSGQFPTFERMAQHYSENIEDYRPCRGILDQVLNLSENSFGLIGIPAIEAKRIDEQLNPQIAEPYKRTLLPYFTYLENFTSNRNAYIGSLFFPMVTYDGLAEKVRHLESKTGISDLSRLRPSSTRLFKSSDPRNEFFYTYFPSTISPEVLLEFVDKELEVNRYRELAVSDGSRLLSRSELLKSGGQPDLSIFQLQSTLDWLDLAIAQQNIFAGDALIPKMSELLFKQDSSETGKEKGKLDYLGSKLMESGPTRDLKQVSLVQFMAGRNLLLLQNLVRYRIYTRMSEKGWNAFSYSIAYSLTSDSYYINLFTGDQPKVEWKENPKDENGRVLPSGWYFDFEYYENTATPGKRKISLVSIPSPAEVFHKSFLQTDGMVKLQRARQKVLSRLLEYAMIQKAKDNNSFDKLKLILVSTAGRKKPQ